MYASGTTAENNPPSELLYTPLASKGSESLISSLPLRIIIGCIRGGWVEMFFGTRKYHFLSVAILLNEAIFNDPNPVNDL